MRKSRLATLFFIISLFVIQAQAAEKKTILSLEAGSLLMELGEHGEITALKEKNTGKDFLYQKETSYLLKLEKYGSKGLANPIQMKLVKMDAPRGVTRIILTYEGGVTATVDMRKKKGYLKMTLVDASPLKDVERISWGPYRTTMQDSIADYLGLARSGDFTFGMLSLDINTDGTGWGSHYKIAHYKGGDSSFLHAIAKDHTREHLGRNHIKVYPFPITVKDSSIAIFGCTPKQELDLVEVIELAENLPHPMENGKWLKRTMRFIPPALWLHFKEDNIEECAQLAKKLSASSMCAFHVMFGNWGHFEPSKKAYPGGPAGLKKTVDTAKKYGVGLVMYTLTTFLKPLNSNEPFLAPVPHDGLQVQGPPTQLITAIDKKATSIVLDNKIPNLEDAFKFKKSLQVIRLDNEIISFKTASVKGDQIILNGCKRAQFGTHVAAHKAKTKAVRLYINGFNNFYPGTIKLQDEMANNMANVALKYGFNQITLDGYESCDETGHGVYAKNRLLGQLYNRCKEKSTRFTGSNFGNYSWHTMSYTSWGEFDKIRGFRGTMLDYRIMRQIQLRHNHMPRKLGQHYPTKATLEDIEWLMARSAGWESGVELHIKLEEFKKNPQFEQICNAIHLWTAASKADVFTDKEKMELRQTDRLYTLSRDVKSTFHLKFVRRWRKPGVQVISPSEFKIKAEDGKENSIAKTAIDYSWTHNPAIFTKAGVSDDLIHRSGTEATEWKVTYPSSKFTAMEGGTGGLQFVLRLAANAPCAVRNPCVTLDGRTKLFIPITLQPGQYLSIVHNTAWVSLYDSKHNVIGESYVRNTPLHLPRVNRNNKEHRISLEAEPVKKGAKPVLTMNLQTNVVIH